MFTHYICFYGELDKSLKTRKLPDCVLIWICCAVIRSNTVSALKILICIYDCLSL